MFKTTILSLSLMAIVLVASTFAQDQRTKAISQLTNNNSKQWIYTGFDTSMGNKGEKCTKGQIWKFYSNGNLTVIECVAGEIRETGKQWSIEVKSSLDVILKIGDINYTLLFPPKQRGKERMTLRIKATIMTQRTTNLRFYYEVD